jgi:2-methylcitrate dehydratase
MKLPRRKFLRLTAGAGALPLTWSIAGADEATTPARLAAYADGLRYEDLDDATVESVKVHIIDALGCGLAAFDE